MPRFTRRRFPDRLEHTDPRAERYGVHPAPDASPEVYDAPRNDPGATVTLKRAFVYQGPNGNLIFGKEPVKPGPEEGSPDERDWWLHVLHDPRARLPKTNSIPADSDDARYRLDRFPSDTLSLRCRCGNRAEYKKADLIRTQGGDSNVLRLAGGLMECSQLRQRDWPDCLAYFVRD